MNRPLFRRLVDLTQHLSMWRQVLRDQGLLDLVRNRALISGLCFLVSFVIIALRLTDVMVIRGLPERERGATTAKDDPFFRTDIVDRHGAILATQLITGSVYANPNQLLDPDDAAEKIASVLPDVNLEKLRARLKSGKKFVWIARHISPKEQNDINQLGVPGVYLLKDKKRVYPYGPLVSHVLGFVGLDGEGLGGVERYFDAQLKKQKEPLKLSLDVRVQHIVREELFKSIEKFSAVGGNAMILDRKTGEVISMVSLPDFNPNHTDQENMETAFNRNTLGIYEPGSTFKIYNTAIALETGSSNLTSVFDASAPIQLGRFKITDFKGQNRPMSVEEGFFYSSNIVNAKMALKFGGVIQQEFLRRFGMFNAPQIELAEIASPMVPKIWREPTIITVSYGYGMAVSPLQLILGVSSVINDGKRVSATLLQTDYALNNENDRVVSVRTSKEIQRLMRRVVTEGTAKKADVPGYYVIGKTGSAHKKMGRGYAEKAKITTFIGSFSNYTVLVMLDDAKSLKETHGYSTAGWNAAPTAHEIIARVAPLLRVKPVEQEDDISEGMIPISHVSPDLAEVE